MKTLIFASVLLLTGCASNCQKSCVFGFGPGSDAFNVVAKHYDDRDPCQSQNVKPGESMPEFCGASRGRTTIYNQYGKTVGYIK
ncbi:hypothetical protein UFOVP623_40 [uncultured Caudovirales phage]|uniref:Lipoprotein n=1 Tax=uncultured Caudovirales phage TaxID=2100421 RepID=A0A6J5N4Y1_9CAUD|nr:hypothetical protein UFOVP623_40 [uncultured Caudovirales phage]